MLVLGRFVGEETVIGNDRTVMTQLTPAEERMLRTCMAPGLQGFAERLLATLGNPIVHQVTDIRTDRSVRNGYQVPHEIPVHRREIYEEKQRERLANAACATSPVLNNPAFHTAGSVAGDQQKGRRRS